MKEVCEIADRHNLFVVEDAAQAVGARLDGRRVGSLGRVGCFSLHPLKNLFCLRWTLVWPRPMTPRFTKR